MQKLDKIDFPSKSIIGNGPALVSPIFNTILNISIKRSNDTLQRRKDDLSDVTIKKQLWFQKHKLCRLNNY